MFLLNAPASPRISLTLHRMLTSAHEGYPPSFGWRHRDYLIDARRVTEFHRSFVRWGGFYQPIPSTSTEASADPARSDPSLERMTVLKERFAEEGREQAVQSEPDVTQDDSVDAEPFLSSPDETAAPDSFDPPLSQPEPTSATSLEVNPPPSPSDPSPPPCDVPYQPQQHGRSRRRERLLELARFNAQQPLPSSVIPAPATDGEQKKQEAMDQRAKIKTARESIRERLWKLMGGSI